MKALILAAGAGTRLLPLTLKRPKPLLPVGDRPIVEVLISLLVTHGVREVAINLHHQGQAILECLHNGEALEAHLTYSWEDRLLGSAGAAKKLAWFLDEPFYILYGDVLTDLDLSLLARRHREHGAVLSMALYQVEDPTRAGIVEVDALGRVRRFREKPAAGEVFSDLASAGILVAEPAVLDSVPDATFFDVGEHLVPGLLARDLPVYGWTADSYVLDIGSPERYAQAQADVRAGRVRLYGRGPRPNV